MKAHTSFSCRALRLTLVLLALCLMLCACTPAQSDTLDAQLEAITDAISEHDIDAARELFYPELVSKDDLTSLFTTLWEEHYWKGVRSSYQVINLQSSTSGGRKELS